MKRRFAIAALLLGGCSTNPIADTCDWLHPAKGVCARANASPQGIATGPGVQPGAQPGCPAAYNEDQNYRKGLLERFRRSNYSPSGVPPASYVPPVNR